MVSCRRLYLLPLLLLVLLVLLGSPAAASSNSKKAVRRHNQQRQTHWVVDGVIVWGAPHVPHSIPPAIAPYFWPPPSAMESDTPTTLPTTTPFPTTTEPSPMPSNVPSTSPSGIVLLPTRGPIVTPTLAPTSLPPTLVPSTAVPTNAPTLPAPTTPSDNIFDRPTNQPTIPPTTASPTASNDDNIFDRTVNVTVPINFRVSVVKRMTGLEELVTIWADSLFDVLNGSFGDNSPHVRVLNVQLTVTEQGNRLRLLQERTLTILFVSGAANFAVDPQQVNVEEFQAMAASVIQEAVATDSLQDALTDADNDSTIVDPDKDDDPPMEDDDDEPIPDNDTTNQENQSSGQPKIWRIVLGFALLLLALVTVCYWGQIVYQKRQRRRHQSRLETMRKAQSIPMTSVSQQRLYPSASPVQARTISSDGSRSSAFDGLEEQSANDTDDEEVSEISDPFARELQRAASLDRAAWEEHLRKKDSLEKEAELLQAQSKVSSSPSFAHEHEGMFSVFGTEQSQGAGLEVRPQIHATNSFPYGDESVRSRFTPYGDENVLNQSRSPQPLSRNDAVQWTSEGVALNAREQMNPDDSSFEPYGEKRARQGRSLAESWDLDEHPVIDEDGPSQFSFVYPLKKQPVGGEGPPAGRSFYSDDSPTNEAVHSSVEVTSLGDEYGHEQPRERSLKRKSSTRESAEEVPKSLTSSMLREVQRIAQYVRTFEASRSTRESPSPSKQSSRSTHVSAPRQVEEISQYVREYEARRSPRKDSRQVSTSADSSRSPRRSKVRQYESVSPQRISPGVTPPSATHTRLPRRSLSPGGRNYARVQPAVSDEDRLGISRFSVEKPKRPTIQYRTSHPDNLDVPTDRSASVSPIPSEEFSYEDKHLSQTRSMSSSFNRSASASPNRSLSSLRHQKQSYLDANEGPSSPLSNLRRQNRSYVDTKSEFSESLQGHDLLDSIMGGSSASSDFVPRKRISPRSTNQTFNRIRGKFEDKLTPPIVPPNESWQYSGQTRASPRGSPREDEHLI